MKNNYASFMIAVLMALLMACTSPALSELKTHSVTFDIDGVQTTTTVTDGDRVSKPSDPIKVHYSFEHWSTTAGSPTAYDFSSPITTDMVLYANWLVNYYLITFDSQGGSDVGGVAVAYNTTATLPAAPTKTGCHFGGWWTAVNGGGTQFTASTVVTSPVTIYANWIHKVRFDYGSYSPTGIRYVEVEVNDGQPVIRPQDPVVPPGDGNFFVGWFVSGSPTAYDFETPVTSDLSMWASLSVE